MNKPSFFIVGAPKCGTSALHTYLGQHPQIFLPQRKEPHFFSGEMTSRLFIRDHQKYLALFADADQQLCGEGSTWYLFSKYSAKKIKEFCPEAKIIIMLRDPVEMIYSLHNQNIYSGHENINDFEAALAAEPARREGTLKPPGRAKFLECLLYVEAAKYYTQVKRYMEVFPAEQLRIILFDDFKINNEKIYSEILEFLDLKTNFKPEFTVINSSKYLRSSWLASTLSRLPFKENIKTILPHFYQQFTAGIKNANTIYTKRPPMTPELRASLINIFRDDVLLLGQLLDRDLTPWLMV